ncbi:MAG: XylR family transcriptional regulator [Planctomycetota bacterium]
MIFSTPNHIPRVKLVIETSRGYGQSLLRGIASYAREFGPWSFIQDPNFYLAPSKRTARETDSESIDGIIAHTDDASLVNQLMEMDVPMVMKGITQLPTDIPTIRSNDLEIGKIAADNLISLGFHNLGFCGYRNMYWSKRRRQGFAQRASSADIEIAHTNETNPKKLKRWLTSLPKPVGILACNDDRCRQVIRCALENGLAIPDEVAVLGVDNDEMVCELAEFPLSSIAVANERVGYEAAKLLHQMMQGEKPAGQQIVAEPLYVVQRLSTDTLAIDDTAVRKALYFIQDEIPKDIAVDDVVNKMQMSRRMAEIRFRKATGKSINQQVMSLRIRLVRELLIETTLPIEIIARKAGFSSSAYMGMKFKAETGMAPSKYRSNHSV